MSIRRVTVAQTRTKVTLKGLRTQRTEYIVPLCRHTTGVISSRPLTPVCCLAATPQVTQGALGSCPTAARRVVNSPSMKRATARINECQTPPYAGVCKLHYVKSNAYFGTVLLCCEFVWSCENARFENYENYKTSPELQKHWCRDVTTASKSVAPSLLVTRQVLRTPPLHAWNPSLESCQVLRTPPDQN